MMWLDRDDVGDDDETRTRNPFPSLRLLLFLPDLKTSKLPARN